MLLPTKENLEEIARTNFHQDFGVTIPERISLIQLYRWLIFGFTPLPKNIELQLAHLPIFDPRVAYTPELIGIRRTVLLRIEDLLKDGSLVAKGYFLGKESVIPVEYWHLPLQSISCEMSAAKVDEVNIRRLSKSNNETHIAANLLVDEYKKKYSTLAYINLNFARDDVVRIFDGLKVTNEHILYLKEQVAARSWNKGKAGAKPQHDWKAYERQFNEWMAYYGAIGIDEPEWKNQAAVEKKLLEWGYNKFGEAPAQPTIRRYVSRWLKEPPDNSSS